MTAQPYSPSPPGSLLLAPNQRSILSYAALYLGAALLALAAGFRWIGPGRDFLEYQAYYNAIPERFSLQDTRFEPAFHFLAWTFKTLSGLPYEALASLIAFVSLSIKFTLIRRRLRLWAPAILVYICIFYPTHEYTQIRTAISLAFVYLALHSALDRRLAPAFAFGGIGVLFHYSAALPLLVFAATRLIKGKVAAWLCAVAVLAFALFWREIDRVAIELFANVNPFVQVYALNAHNLQSRPFSVNNLLFYGAICSAMALGWFRRGAYETAFLLMATAGAAMMFLFIGAPELAQRTKEVLFLAVVFAVFRSWTRFWDIIPMAFVAADAALLVYLAFRERLLGG